MPKFLSCSQLRDRTKATNCVVRQRRQYHKYWTRPIPGFIGSRNELLKWCAKNAFVYPAALRATRPQGLKPQNLCMVRAKALTPKQNRHRGVVAHPPLPHRMRVRTGRFRKIEPVWPEGRFVVRHKGFATRPVTVSASPSSEPAMGLRPISCRPCTAHRSAQGDGLLRLR